MESNAGQASTKDTKKEEELEKDKSHLWPGEYGE